MAFKVEMSLIGSGLGGFQGAIEAPNGYIYGIPSGSGNVLKIDPATDTVSTFSHGQGTANLKWAGGVLVGTDIYCVPSQSTVVLKIDTTTDTVTTFGSLSGSTKWEGAALAGNGYIYCAPRNSGLVLKIDPSTDTTSTWSHGYGTGANKWFGAALAPNGDIYCSPNVGAASGDVLKIDPATDTSSLVTAPGGDYKGILAKGTDLYACDDAVLKVDTTTDTVTTFGSGLGNTTQDGAVPFLGAALFTNTTNGLIVVDTGNDTVEVLATPTGAWAGGAPSSINRAVYFVPGPTSLGPVLKVSIRRLGGHHLGLVRGRRG